MRERAKKVLARGAQALGLGGVFLTAVAGGVVLHANHPATRRLAASITNAELAKVFFGRVAVGEVQEIRLGSSSFVRIAQVEVTDPEGQRVILAKGVSARIDLRRLVRSLATGGVPDIALADAQIDDADVLLDEDAKGDLGIARAFATRPSAKPATSAPKPASSESVRLFIPNARVGHASAHGNLVPPKLDAEANDVRARLVIADDRLDIGAEQATVLLRAPRAPGQSGDVRGRATGELMVPLSAAARAGGITMRWDLDGDGAGIPLTAHLSMAGDVLDASADIASVEPDVVRRAFPSSPVTRPLELHAKAHGTLPSLAVTVAGRVGTGTLRGEGAVTLRANQPFHFDADLGEIDASAFAGPASDVTGHVHVEGAIAGGAPTGKFTVTTKPATLAAQRAPAIVAEGAFDAKSVDATFRASEPGVDVDGTLHLGIPEENLTFDVNARSRSLASVARAPGVVSGSATARAKGNIDLARGMIDAHVTADGTGISRAPASASSVHAEASVTGPLVSPVIDVTASAKDVRLTALSKGATAEKNEPLTYPSATAHARILLVPTPRILGAQVHVDGADAGSSIDATASEVLLGPGGVDVRGARVTGLGSPIELDVHASDGATTIRAKGADLDVQRIEAMTGIRELRMLPEGSHVTLDVDLKATSTRTDGHVDVSISGAKDGTAAELHAKLDGHRASGRARVAVGSMGWVEVMGAELDLPGPLSVSTLKRATGALDLRGEVDLSQGASLFAGESIEQISGRAFLSARVERSDARTLPTVYATARTRALDVTFNRDGKSTHVGGVDGAVHVGYDGATDQTEASILTWNETGILGSADAKSRVPLVAWLTGAKPISRDALVGLEIGGVVDVPRRDVSQLPGGYARTDLRGALSLRATVAGSIEHPSVALVLHADDLAVKPVGAARGAKFAPVDGVLEARWDGRDVVATLIVDENEREQPAARKKDKKSGHVRGLVLASIPLADVLAGRPLAWNASGELDVADLELAPLPLPMNLRGALTGRVKLRDLTGNPVLDARGHVDDLTVAGVRVLRGDLKLEAKDGSLNASARINQEDGGNGRVNITSSSLKWHGTEVAWDDAKPSKFDYTLDRMRLAIIRPFVRRSIPEIDGVVDGRGSAIVEGESRVFEGGVTLSGGRLYVNAIGEEVTDVSAVARFERDGAFRIQDATAKIGSGEVKASAAGRMNGLRFESVDLVAVVPSKDGVPLSSEGATFAQANGEVRLSAKMAADRKSLAVNVTVPRAKVTVPSRGTQKLQSLDRDKSIDIGVRQSDGSLVAPAPRPGEARRRLAAAAKANAAAAAGEDGQAAAEPADDLLARFTVFLGDDVQLEGRGVRVYLTGRTIIDLGNEIAMTGQIALRQGGTIDVQGRKFVVDRGTVSFIRGEDPADPIVIAAAYWDAPDRTRIWVEFNGPLKTGKLTLRSEPPFSKNEILSILLFGRADPNQGRAGDARPSDTQAATDVGTGLASSGLNQALGDLDEDFDLEQDKTGANRTRTKLGYRLRRNLKVQIGYAAGFSQREPDTTYIFLEWQFVPQWSLIGTRGDRGTSILDVLFQHRY